jgi:phosphatidylserine/phosphatidylglycerophosphate/cardiolipin synthase-like enzyme
VNGRPTDRESRIEPLAASGGMDRDVRIAHAKTMVIDGAITLMGSMNWTNDAAANSEDLNLVSSSKVAAAYAAHWGFPTGTVCEEGARYVDHVG